MSRFRISNIAPAALLLVSMVGCDGGVGPGEGDAAAVDSSTTGPPPPVVVTDPPPHRGDRPCTDDGFCWLHPRPIGLDLTDVWAAAADDIWAVGENGALLHYDGERWSWWTAKDAGSFHSVHGFASDDIIAVAHESVFRYDGTAWYATDELSYADLRSVWGIGPDDIWAAGYQGREGFVAHFDGETWSEVPSPIANTVRAIHGQASDDVWFGGYDGLYHWDGARIETVIERWDNFYDLFTTEDDVFVAGVEQPLGEYAIMRLDGRELVTIEATRSRSRMHRALWADGDEIWAMGHRSLHLVGGTARTEDNDVLYEAITGVPGIGPIAVGGHGRIAIWDRDAEQWQREDNGGTGGLDDLFVVSDDEAWAIVGNDLLHCEGDRCRAVELGDVGAIAAMWGSGPDDVWVVGRDGNVFRYDGTIWGRPLPSLTDTPDLIDVSGSGPDDVWLAARNHLYHYDGASFTRAGENGELNVEALTVLSEGEVWAVGKSMDAYSGPDVVLRWGGDDWEVVVEDHFGARLDTIAGSGPEDVWVGGRNVVGGRAGNVGILGHFDGSAWTTHRLPTSSVVRGIAPTSTDGREAWIAAGSVYRFMDGAMEEVADGMNGITAIGASRTTVWLGGHGSSVLRARGMLVE